MVLSRVTLPERRRPLLKQLLKESSLLRAIECHDPLSALLGCRAESRGETGKRQFDLLWASGFSHATMLGLPDSEMSLLERRLDSIADIASVTSKPILADADTGGDAMALLYLCRRLEQIGVSGAVVEDKTGAKRTSLASGVRHELEDPMVFVQKIKHAKEGLLTSDFLIFARIESLIAEAGLDDALKRAEMYLRSSADGVVIHSKDRTGEEILSFMKGYRRLQSSSGIVKPLVHKSGATIVIHGNHMIRAAYRGMQLAAASILEHDRALEADAVCASVGDLLQSIGVDARTSATPAEPISLDGATRRIANE